MNQTTKSVAWIAFLGATLTACGGGSPAGEDAGADAARTDASSHTDASCACEMDEDCDDGIFCNGVEVCDPGGAGADSCGCVAGRSPCTTAETCREERRSCGDDCVDTDGDGHAPIFCGGDDCDDTDPNRYPGNLELCDDAAHDEDCDPTTFGDRDADMDGYPDAQCCNLNALGERLCGSDCNDGAAEIHPTVADGCDGIDNDCDGRIDEDPTLTFYRDVDGDGFGLTTETVTACSAPPGWAVSPGDCDDTTRAMNPSAPDTCNGIDDDCDGAVDPGCGCVDGEERDCGPPEPVLGSCRRGVQRCVAGGWAASCPGAVMPTTEVCNGLDDDCDGTLDDGASMVCALGSSHAGTGAFGSCADVAGYYACAGDCRSELFFATPPPESCNGLDDDCDGVPDDPFACLQSSTGNACLTSCGTVGTFACGADCLPGPCTAPEVCNGCDDDGDGAVDEGTQVDCWADADDDGFAALGADQRAFCRVAGRDPVGGCPVGFSDLDPAGAAGSDCDDSDAGRNPGLAERCDGVDQDCDGVVDDGASAECVRPSTYAACLAGRCVVVGCGLGADDCDGDASTGCETATAASVSDCGSCGVQCSGGMVCSSGGCTDHVVQISAGSRQTCGLREGGELSCWGYGLGGSHLVPANQRTYGGTVATEVSIGWDHLCMRKSTGEVLCVFGNGRGQLGNGTTSPGVRGRVLGLADAVEVSAGHEVSCARRATGEVVCWGANDRGQLGDGTTTDSLVPVAVSGLNDAVEIDVGDGHACARRATGRVVCWGANDRGQLGDGTTTDSSVPVSVPWPTDGVSIGASLGFSCAVSASGQTRCWGKNDVGQLGDGTTSDSLVPVWVNGANALEITLGQTHACIREDRDFVSCWGGNNRGQLGDGTTVDRPTAARVPGLYRVLEIDAGDTHTCARRPGGVVSCWGFNLYGQLGDGSETSRPIPTQVVGMGEVIDMGGEAFHSCVLHATGNAECWGNPVHGVLGEGTWPSTLGVRVAVVGLTDGVSLMVGRSHNCAVQAGGGVSCWGFNYTGQLGVDTVTESLTALSVPGVTGAVDGSAGWGHTCVRLDTGEVSCWGNNGYGQLGRGTRSQELPGLVPGLAGVVQVAAEEDYSCARRVDGDVWCWGNAPSLSALVPTQVPGLNDIVGLAAGLTHVCALRATGEVRCWGTNAHGELGDGSETNRSSPIPVRGLTDAVAIMAGIDHSCALRATGGVVCWGSNQFGQIGDGGSVDRLVPVPVVDLGAVDRISGAGYGTCAHELIGNVRCWGRNNWSQVGDGGTTDRSTPVLLVGL